MLAVIRPGWMLRAQWFLWFLCPFLNGRLQYSPIYKESLVVRAHYVCDLLLICKVVLMEAKQAYSPLSSCSTFWM